MMYKISELAELFLNQKHMTGFKYNYQEKQLRKFINFYENNGYTGIRITKPMVETFIYNISEKTSSHYCKKIIMRDFAKFLKNQGFKVP